MKKCIALLLTALLAFSAAVPAIAAEPALTVDASWQIKIPSAPTPAEEYAANLLADVLSEKLGAEIAVSAEAAAPYIAVGAASQADLSETADNGYRITAIDGSIHIGGTGVRGVQAGAARFLETFAGRKVYTRDITVLPKADSFEVPADTDIAYAPFFEYTDTDWLSPRDLDYSLANGLNGGPYRALPAEMGGSVNYLGGFCHTIGGLCESEAHKDTNPEQLALFEGERTPDQPCLTNPDVLAIATKNVLNILSSRYDPNASVQIVSVTQNDNQHYCQCENCRAFEEAHGGVQSATMINFVNQIADAVKAAGYENAAIDTFAYQYTRKAPTGIVPRDNVIVRLCTIECCFHHALDDPNCVENVALMRDLTDWAAICDRIYVWDYTTNYLNTCCVFPDFNVIQQNARVFYENSVKGVYEEGNYYIDGCDAEFGELRGYMIAKALQDPYCDMDAEIDGFLKAYYGAGWKKMRKILDLFTEYGGNEAGHVMIYSSPADSLRLTDSQIRSIDALWAAAKDEAETKAQKLNVTRSELSWRFWKGSVNKGEFSVLNPLRFDAREILFNDLQRFGVRQLSEGASGDYLDCICVRYVPVNEWNQYEAGEPGAETRRFFGRIFEKFAPLLSAFGFYYYLSQQFASRSAPNC